MSSRAGRTVVLVLLLASVTSCSGDDDDIAQPANSSIPLGATLEAEARMTGALDAKSNYDVAYRTTDPTRNSCTGLAEPPTTGANFVVPFPSKLASYRVNAVAAASPFRGAGDYATQDFALVEVKLTPEGDDESARRFVSGEGTKLALVVRPDGSGTFTFDDLEGKPSGSLSGTITWTCR